MYSRTINIHSIIIKTDFGIMCGRYHSIGYKVFRNRAKTMIWVSALQLYEQGKLDLEADIRTYLPDGFLTKLKYDDPITMIDLMNHRGGWQEALYTIQVTDESDIMPLGEALKYSEPPQVFRPGEVEAYSNWGAALAGYIIECVSGMDYGEYLHKNIFRTTWYGAYSSNARSQR